MKRKNLLSGLLAGALVLTSVVVPGTGKEVKAEEYDLTEGLLMMRILQMAREEKMLPQL